MSKIISISILNSDPLRIADTLNSLEDINIKNIHLDIMDTSFVNNISFGIDATNELLNYNFIFDVHLMVGKPKIVADKINLSKIDRLIYHYEISNEEKDKLNYNVKKGAAVNPNTPTKNTNLKEEFVLIMSVEPGLGGQSFIKDTSEKINLPGKVVGVDGGINLETIKYVREADFFVVGSAFFKSEDKEGFLRKMFDIIE